MFRGRGIKAYVPDFKRAFEHFIIHTGGRAVVDEIEKQLNLTPYLTQPSREALCRYGNVSSSSIWYVPCQSSCNTMCLPCAARCQPQQAILAASSMRDASSGVLRITHT